MIFEYVVLNNFGPYQGAHRIDLTVTRERPVILIGALNGSGKTTFLDAMQLALYGKNARCSGRERVSYPDYLAAMINREVPPHQGASIEFAFRSRSNGKDMQIRLVRTWQKRGENVRETLEVHRDGVLDPVASDRWIEFVEDFMPSRIADLFFFDGEKIEALADPQKSADLLREGIHSLLGIDLVESLLASLQQIERKRKIDTVSEQDKAALYAIENQRSEINKSITALAQRRGAAQNAMDEVARRHAEASSEFKRLGGELLSQRDALVATQTQLLIRKNAVEEELRTLAAGSLPLAIPTQILHLVLERARSLRRMKQLDVLRGEAESRDLAIAEFVRSIDANGRIESRIQSYLFEDRQQRYKKADALRALPEGVLDQFSAHELDRAAISAKRLLAELDSCGEQLVVVDRHLAAVPAEATVAKVQQVLEACRVEQPRCEALLGLIDEEMATLRYKLERLKGQSDREAERLGEKLTRDETSKRVIAHSKRGREALVEFRRMLLNANLHRLEGTIQLRFQTLLRKRTLAQKITIDPVSFQISVANDNGQVVPSHRLSAGERQLLAVATLWALAHESGRHLPTVIDTPLSRLDSRHRVALVKNYFPKASHQVILLSTDEEVVAQYQAELAPFVSRYYLIENDEKKRTSRFSDGYFDQAVEEISV
jgi:DNA sulfur modification protein DndD